MPSRFPDRALPGDDVFRAEAGRAAGLQLPTVGYHLWSDLSLHLGRTPSALHGASRLGATLGMVFSVIFVDASWGGMING